MSANGLDVFDKTLQITHTWLDELMADLGPDRKIAWHVLGAVLRSLRDRLQPELAAHLAAQLPLLVRGAFYDQYRPATQPKVTRTLDAFLEPIEAELQFSRPVDVEQAVRSVFALLSRHVSGVDAKVREALPAELRALWEEPAGSSQAANRA